MPEPIFKKIVDDLSSLDYGGNIIFAPWSEALLDSRLPHFVAYGRSKLPKCHIEIQTNGDLLTFDKFKELCRAGVDEFHVSEHFKIADDQYVRDVPRQAIKTYLKLDQDDKKAIHFDDSNSKRIMRMDWFHNRSGLVPLQDCVSIESLCSKCDFPESILSINYKGGVLLCAKQWKDHPTFGNVQDKPLKDIWQETRYKGIRKNLRKGVFELELCRNCWFGYLPEASQIEGLKSWSCIAP